jgi:hypothetical protein
MQTVQIRTRTGKDGTLALEVPTHLEEVEMDVTVSFSPRGQAHERRRWPDGWVESTYGSIPDLERPPQGPPDEREGMDE